MPVDITKSERILAEVKKLRGQGRITDIDEEKVKMVIFSLSDNFYAFYVSEVQEILPLVKEPADVPGMPDFIIGIINVRGNIESVIDIHRFMGLGQASNTPDTRIIIAAKEGIRSGIRVDYVADVIDIPVSSVDPPIPNIDESVKEFVIGRMTYDNQNVNILDVGNIFKRTTI